MKLYQILVVWAVVMSMPAVAQKGKPTPPAVNDPAIAFEASGTLVVMDADGRNRVTILAAGNKYHVQPTWSPDGSKLAFVSNRDKTSRAIYIVNRDGSALCKVVDVPEHPEYGALPVHPAWSPRPLADGKEKIAYQTLVTEGGHDIFLVNATCPGGPPQNITNSAGLSEFFPHWSPGADRMALWGLPAAGAANIFAYTVTQDATGDFHLANEVLVTSVGPLAGKGSLGLDWARVTPDLLAVNDGLTNGEYPGYDIWALSIQDPAAASRITNTADTEYAPSWSPDDKYIVVTGRSTDGAAHVSIVEVSTGARTGLVRDNHKLFNEPDWRRCDRVVGNGVPNCAGTLGEP